jgi:two-component system CheB/CheR fusion protein
MTADSSTAPAIGIIGVAALERASLRELLRRGGSRVTTYATAERFLLRYRAGRFDCLLVSLSLPRGSGLVLLDRLRAAGDDVPIVLLAAEADVATAVTAMRAGAADFMERPYTHAALLKRVRRILHDPPRTAPR